MMKLLSYHIENYGKIHDADGYFDKNLTCICEENGFGKTTLASFIKAMFYGLAPYTSASKTFCDRQHFYPFSGGKFGGNITFEMNGKTYKIERFFDKKSNKGDECKVYCNGALYTGFGEDIGRSIFSLDEESFQKTVFLTANEIEISSTHSINEKLNNTVDGGEDCFELAVSALEKAKKELRAARGSNDLISSKKAQILDLTGKIRNLETMSEGLSSEYVERERLTQEIDALQLQTLSAGKWEIYNRMAAQERKGTETLRDLKAKYPNGFPSREERAWLQNVERERAQLQSQLKATVFGEAKEEKLSVYRQKFAFGVPEDEDISDMQEKIHRLTVLKSEKERLGSGEATDKQKRLAHRFANGVPTEEELAKNRILADSYKKKSLERNAIPLSATPQKKKSSPLVTVLLILALIMSVIGVALLFVELPIGLTLICVGIFLAAGTRLLKNKNIDATPNVGLKLSELQADMHALEEKIRAFTVPYQYYSEAGVLFDLAALEEDVRIYREYVKAETARNAAFHEISIKEAETRATVEAFLTKYQESSKDLQNGLTRLATDVHAYQVLLSDETSAKEKGSKFQTRLAELDSLLSEFCQTYALTDFDGGMDALNVLEVDCRTAQKLEKELTDLRLEMQEYKRENALFGDSETHVDDLQLRLSAKQSERALLDRRIEATEREVERLNDYKSELECAEEQLEGYNARYDLLSDTLEMIKTAEQSLKDKYVAPIKDRFTHYASVIEQVLNEKVSMDKDFRVVFERGGEARSDKHLSAGERSICALCLRLALIDNMYEAEQPFLLMDDPFVHLDAPHMARAAELVKVLSKDRQILYFCCHDSRCLVQ